MKIISGIIDDDSFLTTGKELKKIKYRQGVKWVKDSHWIDNYLEEYKSLVKTNVFNFGGILIPVKYFVEICRTYDNDEIIILSLDIPRRELILESDNSRTVIKQQLQAEINDEIIIKLENIK